MSERIEEKTQRGEMSEVLIILKNFTIKFNPSVLGSFSPAQVLYSEINGKIEIEFKEYEYRLSELMWLAPEMLKKDSKPVSNCQSKIL